MNSSSRKGCLWALNPAKIDKMEEEMQKWKRKDLPAIRRSMANPGQKCTLSNEKVKPHVFFFISLTVYCSSKQMSWTN